MIIMKTKKLAVLAAIVAVIMVGAVSAAFAATEWKTPADILAGITGKSVEEIQARRQEGVSYGAQAVEDGELEAFKAARSEFMKERLAEAVEAGDLTQEEADERLAAMETRQESCTGDGTGAGSGLGGMRQGRGDGTGAGRGFGMGGGRGNGGGRGAGACIGTAPAN